VNGKSLAKSTGNEAHYFLAEGDLATARPAVPPASSKMWPYATHSSFFDNQKHQDRPIQWRPSFQNRGLWQCGPAPERDGLGGAHSRSISAVGLMTSVWLFRIAQRPHVGIGHWSGRLRVVSISPRVWIGLHSSDTIAGHCPRSRWTIPSSFKTGLLLELTTSSTTRREFFSADLSHLPEQMCG
jgi:hypothetical protein